MLINWTNNPPTPNSINHKHIDGKYKDQTSTITRAKGTISRYITDKSLKDINSDEYYL